MMGSRRGLLGGMAGLGLGVRKLGSGAEIGMATPQQVVSSSVGLVGRLGGPVNEAVREDPRWRAFRKAMDKAYDSRSRIEQRLHLTGGVPPGIGACRSWRPWFAAAAVERWRDEHLPHMSVVERAVRLAVFGAEEGD